MATLSNTSSHDFQGFLRSNSNSIINYSYQTIDTSFEKLGGLLQSVAGQTSYAERYYFPLSLKAGGSAKVIFEVREFTRFILNSSLKIDLVTEDHDPYDWRESGKRNRPTTYFMIFFSGLLIFQLFYISIQWSLVRKREYFFYICYIVTLFVYFFERFALFFSELYTLFSIAGWWVDSFNDVLLVLPAFFYFRFARYFLDLPKNRPRLNRLMRYMEWVILVLASIVFICNRLVPNDLDKNIIVYSSVLIQFVFTVITMVLLFKNRSAVTNFVLVGSGLATVSHILAMFYPLLFNTGSFEPVVFTMIGLMAEIAIFNSGLLFKARATEIQRLLAQNELISELKKKEKLQTEYAQVRDKIARDLHDDIGSTLSSVNIYSYAAKIKLQEGKIGQAKELLNSIEQNALLTLNSMGDLVWAVNPINDSNEKLIQRIQSFAYGVLGANNCSFKVEIDPLFLTYTMNHKQRKNVLLTCKEAINNIAKYAQASQASLRIEAIDDEKFRVCIEDNGVGIDRSQTSVGNGLKSMETRALEIGSDFTVKSQPGGTLITFLFHGRSL